MTNLFTTILNMSITASYLFLAVIAIRIFLKKVPKFFSYVLWLPVLIRLVVPFSFKSSFSFFSFLKPTIQTSTGGLEYIPHNIGFIQNPAVDIGINRINNAVNTSFPHPTLGDSVNPMQIIMDIASIIWVVGMVIFLFYSIISYIKVINNLKTAILVKDNIFETDRNTTPFVCGFIKPKIFIPVGMSENELSYILVHEQVHIKRLDYLIKPVAFLVLVVHWFNPLIWLSFAYMSKDMEMSCDERVLKKLGNDIKGCYSNSLLSLSVKRSGLLTGSPLAFGESNIKSRIKNIITYKKPTIGIIVAAIIVTTSLIVAFTANPKNEQSPKPTIHSAYNIEALIANKTLYIGNNSKVVALIDAMSLPAGITRNTVELQTTNHPYGITINLNMKDASSITVQGALNGAAFYPNSILLFSLIDNVDIINYKISDDTGKYSGASYTLPYTRETVENLIGEDVRPYGASTDTLKNLIDILTSISFDTGPPVRGDKIEKYLEIIMSPNSSSNPNDYIKAHQNEYQSIIKMGDAALYYLQTQSSESTNSNNLRSQIIMALCNDLLDDRNNIITPVNNPEGLLLLNIVLPENWSLDRSQKVVYNFLDEKGENKGTIHASNYLDNFEFLTQMPNHSAVTNDEYIDIPLGMCRLITLDSDNGSAASGLTGTHDTYYASISIRGKAIYMLNFTRNDKKPETRNQFIEILKKLSLK